MYIMDWAETQQEDSELEATLKWCLNDKKGTPWAQQLEKLKAHLGSLKNQPEGKCIVRNADKLTLLGGMLYYQHSPKYLEEKKWFVILRAHQQMALNGCHRDAGHQGKKRNLNLVTDRFRWPGVQEAAKNIVCDCKRCQAYGGIKSRAPMVSLKATALLQLVHLDFTSFKLTMDLERTPEVKHVLGR